MNRAKTKVMRNDRFFGRLMTMAFCCLAVVGGNHRVWAHQEPPGCTAAGANALLLGVPDDAMHGEEICVSVDVYNTCPSCCNADVTVDLTLPDGTVLPITNDASVPRGDSFICPSPYDPRCLTPGNCTITGMIGYRYVVGHADEKGGFGNSCPLVAETGIGSLGFVMQFAAKTHMANEVGSTRCTAVIIAASHESCTDTCDNDEVCVDGICVPPVCGNGTCEPTENCTTCPKDCFAIQPGCGNGFCEPSLDENCLNCPADCNGRQSGKASGRFCCGVASGKLPGGCDDLRCTSHGFACSEVAVSSCCGDGACGEFENGCNCALDCGPAPSTEINCTDGLDDDCDGLIDGSDLDCPCGGRGSSCNSSADCCSGVCLGRGVCR